MRWPACARRLDRRAFLRSCGAVAAASLAPALRGQGARVLPSAGSGADGAGAGRARSMSASTAGSTGRASPIVMIHGGPGGTHAGFLNALPLADERAVILYDQLDSGHRITPTILKNWTVGRFTDEVDAVRRAVGVPRWHVLGLAGAGRSRSNMARGGRGACRTWCLPARWSRREAGSPMPMRSGRSFRLTSRRRSAVRPASPDYSGVRAGNRRLLRELPRARSDGRTLTGLCRSAPELGFNPELYETMWGSSEFVATGTLRNYDGEPLLAKLDGPHTLFIDGQYDEARPVTLGAFAARVRRRRVRRHSRRRAQLLQRPARGSARDPAPWLRGRTAADAGNRSRWSGGEREGDDRPGAGEAFRPAAHGHRPALSRGRAQSVALGRRSRQRVRGGARLRRHRRRPGRSRAQERARVRDRLGRSRPILRSVPHCSSASRISRARRRRGARRSRHRNGDRARSRREAVCHRFARSPRPSAASRSSRRAACRRISKTCSPISAPATSAIPAAKSRR